MRARTIAFLIVCASSCAGLPAYCAEPAVPSDPDGPIVVTVDPAKTNPISPYVYGVNFATKIDGLPVGIPFDRSGGNRWTAYNWETNTSNAGADYLYQNDRYLGTSTEPGGIVSGLIADDRKRGMASLVTVPMQGLVSADDRGPVATGNAPDLSRFRRVVFEKGSVSREPFTARPVASDDAVYIDEFVWALDRKFAGQEIFGANPKTRPVFVSLDNEPELWSHTHLELQGKKNVSADDYIGKTIALSTALKKQFPNVVIFGPAHYGFLGMYNWSGEIGASPNQNNWFTDRYLAAVSDASRKFGRRLVDVYDFHWYPEATDSAGARITGLSGPALNDEQVQAIVQSPRSLWDAGYRERSWIVKDVIGQQPIALLERLQSRIDAHAPGMKLALTEYNNGGAQHIAGTIAQADNLGLFGARGLFAASLWQMTAKEPFILAAFRAYRDFDGAGHDFGDTSIRSTSSDPGRVVVYVSTDSTRPDRVVMVAINRSARAQSTTVSGQALSGTAQLFQMTATTAAKQGTIRPVPAGTQPVSGTSMKLDLPPLSVTTIDIHR